MSIKEPTQKGTRKFVIGGVANPHQRVRGSHPFAMLQDRTKGLWPLNDELGFFPLELSTPDIALQFSPCLADIPVDPGINLEKEVIDAVRGSFPPDADVRYLCDQGTGRIGVWMRPAGSRFADLARERGLEHVAILESGEDFALWINSSYISSQATEAWNLAPKNLNHDGLKDDNGPVHLTGFNVSFLSPNQIVTTVTGYDETPWPDAHFTLTITDSFSTSGGQVVVSSDRNLDTDITWEIALTTIFTGLAAILSPWFLIGAIGFGLEGVAIKVADPGSAAQGAGQLVQQQIPVEIYIKGKKKLVPIYSRVNVNTGGVSVGGIVLLMDRMPSVTVGGPDRITAQETTTAVTRVYQANPDDLLAPLNYTWEGDASFEKPKSRVTNVTFFTSNVVPGHPTTLDLRVNVVDADGMTATGSMAVDAFVAPSDPDMPNICRVKPWLPQCQ